MAIHIPLCKHSFISQPPIINFFCDHITMATSVMRCLGTHMRYEVEKCVTSQGAHCQSHQVLYQMVVEDFLHDRNQGYTDETYQADDGDCQQGTQPHCKHQQKESEKKELVNVHCNDTQSRFLLLFLRWDATSPSRKKNDALIFLLNLHDQWQEQ